MGQKGSKGSKPSSKYQPEGKVNSVSALPLAVTVDPVVSTPSQPPPENSRVPEVVPRSSSRGYERVLPIKHDPAPLELSKPREKSNPTVSGPPKFPGSPGSNLESFFQKYKDPTEDAILAEGVESFCEDLGVNPTDFIVLVIAWKFQASEMCRFTREEFINGCQKLKAINAGGLKKCFPDLIRETQESERSFKELYQFTFSFGLDHSQGQRVLPTDMAIQLWELLFTHKHYPILSRWIEFLQKTETRSITRDTWNMFLPFLQTMKDDLSNYDELEAWPTLFDDFVELELETNR